MTAGLIYFAAECVRVGFSIIPLIQSVFYLYNLVRNDVVLHTAMLSFFDSQARLEYTTAQFQKSDFFQSNKSSC